MENNENRTIPFYKISISIIFGILGFVINFHTIKFPFPPYIAVVLIGLLFPMLITLSWGWKYGFLSALTGGCQTMWCLWGPSNGYAIFFVVPTFTLWIVWHGLFASLRKRQDEPKWWLNKYIIEIPFRLISTINLLTLSRWAITLNPPPWTWALDAPNTIPMHFSNFIVIKQAAVGYIILLLSDVLLNFGFIRKFFRLKEVHNQTNTGYIISASLLIGAVFWFIDSIFGSLVFHTGKTFLELFALSIPSYNIFVRAAFVLSCLVGGLLAAKLLRKQRESDIALKESEERLRTKLDYILTPDEDVKDVVLKDLVDLKDLQRIQDAFAAANDVASVITDVDGKPITKASNFCVVCKIVRSTEKGNRNCIKSDKILGEKAKALMKPTYEECHSCGFVDASAPIIVGGKHIANWMIGQSNVMGANKDRIEAYAKEIDADTKEMIDAFKKMPEKSLAKFKEVLDLLWCFARELSSLGYNNLKLERNIAKLKKAEEALQKAHDDLDVRVKERTAELESVNSELEAFSYSVSHDLRSPLRGIDGFSQVLLEDYADKLDKDGRHYLERVRAGTQRMGQLIDDILQLSRDGRRKMKPENVDLSEMARKISGELEESGPERKVQFIIKEGLVLNGDAHLLQIVFNNLLENAWKFTSKRSEARIEFGVTEEEGKSTYYVKDNGVGFNMKYAGKLFTPFHRLHRAEEFEGTGIGLANVQRIIHRHGGRIWAESEMDVGTTFFFTL